MGTKRDRVRLIAGVGGMGVAAIAGYRYAILPRPPAGFPVRVTIEDLPPGKLRTVEWHGRSVFVLRRSPGELDTLARRENELVDPESAASLQPDGCRNRYRSLRPEVFVAVGQCTHQGCVPALRGDADGRNEFFLCPCHASTYDLSGRIFRGGLAPANLVVPEYRFEGDHHVVIGET